MGLFYTRVFRLAFISRMNFFSDSKAAGLWLTMNLITDINQIRGDPARAVALLLVFTHSATETY